MNTSTRDFSLGIGSLGLLRIALPFIPVPKSVAPAVDFAILIVVFVVTIWSIYRMMSTDLNLKQVLLLTLCGVAVHVCGVALNVLVFHGQGVGSIIALAIAQTGLPIWCIGLGAMIASLLREKNILIPVAIFLVSWDIFLVLSPNRLYTKNDEIRTSSATARRTLIAQVSSRRSNCEYGNQCRSRLCRTS